MSDDIEEAFLARMVKPATKSELVLSLTYVRGLSVASFELSKAVFTQDPEEIRKAWAACRKADAELEQLIRYLRGEEGLPNG